MAKPPKTDAQPQSTTTSAPTPTSPAPPQAVATGDPGASPSTSSSPSSSGASSAGTLSGDLAKVEDAVEGEVTRVAGSIEAAAGPSKSIAHITQPEQAVAALKTKVSEMHKLINDIGHYAEMPFNAIEAASADIGFLLSFIRSKV